MNVKEEVVTMFVPAAAEYVDLVRLSLYGIASKMGFNFEEIEDMKVALSEACNNAVLHAYGDLASGELLHVQTPEPRVEIRFIKQADALSIVVKDDGNSFDAAAAARKAESLHGKSIGELEAGGLGLYLMQALMDQVEVLSGAGTQVMMTKRLTKSGELA
ncbi:putative anti-sigma regulatory factor, serine/threonine protein kinase [Paenibacillus curdlanolyticus YK9]|uniref:Putative anti-sigma regulatory factor, serine/threonine protein kinase n=1 Tax=Paenibacillus curdlanolyticus YK9 TaxID=717606 RepID=E0I9V2_9BACL|nr:anti-sigma B factor RsbW [Paenibacillus curdlanolyticus]EFM10529.1 putative anti-sigma regulatory factor, serine/threonine protein kinase [Paenibacillus curdlanolyticus YK9]